MTRELVRRGYCAGALLALCLLAAACGVQRGSLAEERHPFPPPFERAPYLQAVTDSSAVVRWRVSSPDTPTSFRYRSAGGAWRTARIERLPADDRRVQLTGLLSDQAIEYRVSAGGTTLRPYRFRTAASPGDAGAVRVLGLGDSGQGTEVQSRIADLLFEEEWDVWLHVGDIAYPDGTAEEFTVRHFQVYRSLLARLALFPTPGNHDLRTDGGRPYDRAFEWPGQTGGRYYRFRWGRALFVSLDTSSPGVLDSLSDGNGSQYEWLERTLHEAATDSSVAWTVVYTHYPPYSHATGIAGHGSVRSLRRQLGPLFAETGVDIVLTGHDHHYERTHPLLDGDVVPAGCGTVYFVTGGGGGRLYARSVEPGRRSARADRRHHYLSLELQTGIARGRAVTPEGSVLDQFRLRPYDPGQDEGSCSREK